MNECVGILLRDHRKHLMKGVSAVPSWWQAACWCLPLRVIINRGGRGSRYRIRGGDLWALGAAAMGFMVHTDSGRIYRIFHCRPSWSGPRHGRRFHRKQQLIGAGFLGGIRGRLYRQM